ncbi:RnfABCDGE type electron transport complex subunit G [Succinivibrio dextrinosolvens]|uniref:Electron transport complex protein RnfG n=1 Tax=Succinivibrio dextrinosolvens TaxID=83771 RepID=A0A662ZCA6_9GAMM|nr:RnfABCDGE type electron transport complex subunit G [Succinivibrio dextrinosolvens]SFK42247.1 electron transport complex protein RnfG [Succinivibrio dextrinosolvens]
MNKNLETVLDTNTNDTGSTNTGNDKNKKKKYKYSRTARAILSGLSLAFVASLCVGMIMYTSESTEQMRENNRANSLKAKINSLLPDDARGDNIRLTCYTIQKSKNVGHNQKLYIASKDLEIKGYIMTYSTSLGYSDPLVMIAGFTPDKKVYKADIYFSQETPGLGDKVDRDHGNFLDQLSGHSLLTANWDVKKNGGDFDFITGSTVTSRATVIATYQALKELNSFDIRSLKKCKVK